MFICVCEWAPLSLPSYFINFQDKIFTNFKIKTEFNSTINFHSYTAIEVDDLIKNT